MILFSYNLSNDKLQCTLLWLGLQLFVRATHTTSYQAVYAMSIGLTLSSFFSRRLNIV